MGFNPIDLALGNMNALRVSNERLKKENAKLREELDFCLKHVPNCDGCEAMLDCDECLRADSSQKEHKRLNYENEKLRELVRELLTDPDAWDYDYFKYRMRELEIDV